ncbi:MAG: FkbM family methyltransferase [Pseudomonadota bacterium]
MNMHGIDRSRAVYRQDLDHLASLETFCRPFVSPGDLVFDIGAHMGDRIVAFRALGARVIALEPQPALAALLQDEFATDARVTVLRDAIDAVPGQAVMKVNSANPTLSTLSQEFVQAAGAAEGWRDERWNDEVQVDVTTLDALIDRFGVPAFVKIDVEGFEDRALMGLSRPLPGLSFEVTMIAREVGSRVLDHLHRLGDYRFRLSLGESHYFHHENWLDGPAMHKLLRDLPESANSGDVYALLASG